MQIFIAALFIALKIGSDPDVLQWRMAQRTVVHPDNEILLRNKKELTSNMHNSMDESQTHGFGLYLDVPPRLVASHAGLLKGDEITEAPQFSVICLEVSS